jgi:hypothetical protein
LIGDDDNGGDRSLRAVKERCKETTADNKKLFTGVSLAAHHSGRAV